MEYVALAELAVIVLLALLLAKVHAAGVKALLDLASASELERAELLNAARNPNYLMVGGPPPTPGPPREPSPEEQERARNFAKIGTVEPPA